MTLTQAQLTLPQVLDLIAMHGLNAHAFPGAGIVVFHGDNCTPPSFVRPQADGTFARKAVLNALRAN